MYCNVVCIQVKALASQICMYFTQVSNFFFLIEFRMLVCNLFLQSTRLWYNLALMHANQVTGTVAPLFSYIKKPDYLLVKMQIFCMYICVACGKGSET